MTVADWSCEDRLDQTHLMKKFILAALLARVSDTVSLSFFFFFFFLKKSREKRQEIKTQP